MKSRTSLRFRLASLFVTILLVTLLVICIFLYEEFSTSHRSDFDRSLYNYAVDVARGVNVNLFGDLSLDADTLMGTGKVFPFAIGRSFIELLHSDGGVIGKSRELGTENLPLPHFAHEGLFKERYEFQSFRRFGSMPTSAGHSINYREISLLVNNSGQPVFILQIAVPQTFLERENSRLLELFFIAIPMAILISMFGGIYFSGKALVPIQLIIDKARSLDPSHLAERLPVSPVNDELRSLSVTLNEFLERMQHAFESQERFVADASHQLKTPLAILRGELDVAKGKSRTPEETREMEESFSQELERLSKIVDDLLILARVDAGIVSLSLKTVRLDEILIESVSRLEKIAKLKNISIKMNVQTYDSPGSGYEVKGDEDLLQSMISEIIENAIKYSSLGQMVSINLSNHKDDYIIEITDAGKGIADLDREKIFERFYRVPDTTVQGSGLGLSISQKIAEIHGGEIKFIARPDGKSGSVFTIKIKKI